MTGERRCHGLIPNVHTEQGAGRVFCLRGEAVCGGLNGAGFGSRIMLLCRFSVEAVGLRNREGARLCAASEFGAMATMRFLG